MINEKTHISTIISSITKSYNNAKLTGLLNSSDIYLLDFIYKILNDCNFSLTKKQIKILNNLYSKLLYNSKQICKTENKFKKYYFENNKPEFIQAETIDCNTLPTQDLIYYWQESLDISKEDILELIDQGNYLETKSSDLKNNFTNDKNIEYSNIGLICFALNKTSLSDNYHIYDNDNYADITEGFESFYNQELKTRIFISNNIYSYGIMNFKIKKI